MRKFSLVIFDWNGTLQDDLQHIYECGVQRIFRLFDLPCPSLDEFRREVAPDFMRSFYWPRGIPKEVTARDLNAVLKQGLTEKGSPAGLFADAPGVIVELRERGYQLAVVSGYVSDQLEDAVARSGLCPNFSWVLGDVRDKPSVFSALMEVLGHEASETAVIGDTDKDALAAAAAGATPFICPRGFHPLERIEATRLAVPRLVVVDSLDDLLRHFP